MIKINNDVVVVNKFPDGTPRININVNRIAVHEGNGYYYINISWIYEDISEMPYLMMVKKHLDRYFLNAKYCLFMPYIPNARMDRVKHDDEVFTLKHFCDFINSLHFAAVRVMDAHSNVSAGMINNCINVSPVKYIKTTIESIHEEDIILYFPDSSAAKRYSEMLPTYMYCYGEKTRNWNTGDITGLEIRTNGIDLQDKTILMIDDIISYGGSMYYGAKALLDLGVSCIYAYATHTENSVLDNEKGKLLQLLNDGWVEGLYTTNSLYSGEHEKIKVLDLGEIW